jgi:repressor LexA
MAITRRQKEVLDCIASFVEENGFSPSYEEIARTLKLASLATVHKHITALQTKNYLKRGHNQSRSVDVAPKYLQEQRRNKQEQRLEVPLLGRIAAGQPVESVEQHATLSFADFLGNSDTFAHICSGDMVLVEKVRDVKDGDIVVALIEGSETTLKRYYREANGMIRLQPANSMMKPIFVTASNLEIQGRLLAVLRKY